MRECLNDIRNGDKYNNDVYQLILEMNIKRGRNKNLDAEEIRKKMYSSEEHKKGEYWEFLEQYEISNGKLTPELALEMADIVYYTSQENCPDDIRKISTELEEKVDISHELAQKFCLIKYRCRLEHTKETKDYRRIEYNTMTDFLNKINLNQL